MDRYDARRGGGAGLACARAAAAAALSSADYTHANLECVVTDDPATPHRTYAVRR